MPLFEGAGFRALFSVSKYRSRKSMFCKFMKLVVALVICHLVFLNTARSNEDQENGHRKDFLIPTKKSIAQFEARVAKNGRDFRSAIALARLYMRQAREQDDFDSFIEAEQVLKAALKQSPNENSIKSFLAESLMAQHRFADAKNLASQVLATEPNSVMSLSTIGDANLQLGKYDEAEELLKKLVLLTDSPAAIVRLVRHKEITGKTGSAIQLAQSALQKQQARHGLKSTEAWYHWRLGNLYLESGSVDEAKQHFQAAVRIKPDDSESLAALAKVAFIQGNVETAIKLSQSAIKIAEKPPYLILLGNIYQASDQTEQAKPHYFKAKTLMLEESKHPQAGPAHARELARFLLQQEEQVDMALRLARQDFQLRSDLFADDLLAWAYYKNDKLAEARTTIEKAMQVNSNNAEILFHAGMIAAALGDVETAKKRLTKALEVNPHFSILSAPTARRTLAQLVAN